MHLAIRSNSLVKSLIDERNNPLAPAALAQYFADAIKPLGLEIKVRLIIFKLFERYVFNPIDTEYEEPLNKDFSELGGPKGSVTALNFSVDHELKTKSAGTRDYRYADFGKIDQYIFDKTHKFDYIDTRVRVEGASSKASVVIPLRIIRYAGT